MNAIHDLASKFTSANLDKGKLHAFAEHIAHFEAQTGFPVKRALVNGLAPFDDIATVEFDIPKSKLASALEKLLGNGHVNPNVIINGLPAFDHYHVRVMGGR